MTVLAFIIGVVVLVVGLAVSIALHEVGHLAPAKAFGVRVGQYMIGFGPTVFSRRVGETEYGFKLLPLGGYISMAGMYPPSAATTGEGVDARPRRRRLFETLIQDARTANDQTLQGDGAGRAFYQLPVYKRVIIMLGGPAMNLVLAIIECVLGAAGLVMSVGSSKKSGRYSAIRRPTSMAVLTSNQPCPSSRISTSGPTASRTAATRRAARSMSSRCQIRGGRQACSALMFWNGSNFRAVKPSRSTFSASWA